MDEETSKQFAAVDGRFVAVEVPLRALEVDVAVIRSNYATKADVLAVREDIAKLESAMLKWIVGTSISMWVVTLSGTLTLTKLFG